MYASGNSPGQVFAGRVVRTARSVDPQSRTLLTEIQILNAKGVLLPGMYADVEFVFNRANPPLVIPATALLPLTDGIKVVEVDSDHRLHHRTIKIERDYGSYVESDSGVTEGSTVVLNPTDALTDGLKVRLETDENLSDTAGQRRAAGPNTAKPELSRIAMPVVRGRQTVGCCRWKSVAS